MVVINGVKYSCETCIRGHRAAQCTHTDGPLQMIRRKGRPSTTCGHCKELRRTKNFNPSGGCMCASARRLAVGGEEDASRCRCDEGEPCRCHTKRKTSRRQKVGSCHSTESTTDTGCANNLGTLDLEAFLGLNGPSPYVDVTTPTLSSLGSPLQGSDIKSDSTDDLQLPPLSALQQDTGQALDPPSTNEVTNADAFIDTHINDIDIPFSINELNELYKEVSPHTSHSK
ncbi:cup2p [Saccharomyces arboricola H-6]|uniref:Cup2p n=1 Tax=Saccharomyces arboricola (strain H-6 / AS 2.3317 / CBS 10644) TaxID=1160507 RepID=J8LNX6_SACAR|nr:cup2p [Saccharomyces arboricola H-6]